MSEQPEALRIADELIALHGPTEIDERAAAELRRLHEVNQELLEALKAVYDTCSWGDEASYDAMEKARAAIARAEGETK